MTKILGEDDSAVREREALCRAVEALLKGQLLSTAEKEALVRDMFDLILTHGKEA